MTTQTDTTQAPADHDLAWAAGYLDGEGCFLINSHTYKGRRVPGGPVVTVGSTQLPPLVRMHELFGGSIRLGRAKSARHKPAYYWSIHGDSQRAMLSLVEPFMVEKREQAAMLALYPGDRDAELSEKINLWLRRAKTLGYDHDTAALAIAEKWKLTKKTKSGPKPR